MRVSGVFLHPARQPEMGYYHGVAEDAEGLEPACRMPCILTPYTLTTSTRLMGRQNCTQQLDDVVCMVHCLFLPHYVHH